MSVNSSSSSNVSLLHPHLSANHFAICLTTSPSSIIFVTFGITNTLLLLPLCLFILYLGLQRWHQQRSTTTAAMSPSDSFTYHVVTMELIGGMGYIFNYAGVYLDHVGMVLVGYSLCSYTSFGEMFFHILTCLERYLAVVHPITYVVLRGERGIRIRNISTGCVWLLCTGGGILIISEKVTLIMNFCLLIFSLIFITFCSLSVLCVLIRPGPGEQGGYRERVDQLKQRAFCTIVAILVVLLLRVLGNLVCVVLYMLSRSNECVMIVVDVWFNLPSCLVLPLLFLHRAGILTGCKNISKEREGLDLICIK